MASTTSLASHGGELGQIHLAVRSHCDACGFQLLIGEPFLCFECPATSPTRIYGLFRLPLHSPLGQTFRRLSLCRLPFCDVCNEGPDVATIHTECFNVFMKKCSAAGNLERLACFTTWREPWHTAPSLGLRPRLDIKRAMHLAAELCGMPKLRSLPPEIAEIIRLLSDSAVFWRYASVLELADRASTTESKFASHDISEIYSWERGLSPILIRDGHSATLNIFFRIKIDSRGISSIERLVEAPSPSSSRSDSFAYVVETEDALRNTALDFKFGLCRAAPTPGINLIHIWDKPCPQKLDDCVLYGSPRLSKQGWFRQLRTIDPRDCTGVTFFLGFETWAIHAHSASQPTAESTFRRLFPERQHDAVWAYVPFPPKDRVEAFGIQNQWSDKDAPRQGSCYLLRTALCGDIAIGTYQQGETTVRSRTTTSGLALIYSVPDFFPVSFIGLASNSKDHVDFMPDVPVSPVPLFRRPLFSSAPLSGVIKTQIFHDPETGFCRGILLAYGDGSQRALGQCRVGLDPSTTCGVAIGICIANFKFSPPKRGYQLRVSKVEVTQAAEHSHPFRGIPWQCFPMKGRLEFWYRRQESQLHYIAG